MNSIHFRHVQDKRDWLQAHDAALDVPAHVRVTWHETLLAPSLLDRKGPAGMTILFGLIERTGRPLESLTVGEMSQLVAQARKLHQVEAEVRA